MRVVIAAYAATIRVRERIHGMGADVVGSTPERFATFMKAETAKWAKVIKQTNIPAQ